MTGSAATTAQMRQIKAMRKNNQGYNACPEWNADCCRHLSERDCKFLHRCHRCGKADHAVTVCSQEELPTPSEKPEATPQADDLGITDIDLSDTDSKLAQAEVFALSEGERNGQKPAIDILRAFASLPYGDLRICSLAEAVAAMETGTTVEGPDPIADKLGDTFLFTLNDLKPISAPSMRKDGGEYRVNQLAVIAATTSSAFYEMISARRRDCLESLWRVPRPRAAGSV